MTDEVKSEAPRKYAGKYDTVEQLEEGYNNAAKVFQTNADLNKRLEEFTTVPEDYIVPEDVPTSDDIHNLKTIARSAGVSQKLFEKMAREAHGKEKAKNESLEKARNEVGEETLQVLRDYVHKNYPQSLSNDIMNKLIVDSDARREALSHREKLLNSSSPGIGKVTVQNHGIERSDVLKAREDYMKAPHDTKLRDRYINMTAQFAQSRG